MILTAVKAEPILFPGYARLAVGAQRAIALITRSWESGPNQDHLSDNAREKLFLLMAAPMTQALSHSTLFARGQLVAVEPDVKSAETCGLFNAGVNELAETAKTADPSCYTTPVSQRKADPAAGTAGLFENQIRRSEMQHIYNDGGRAASGFAGKAGDCVCRSIAIVTGLPYAQVYHDLACGTGAQRATKRKAKRPRSARNGISTKRKWFRDYMKELGFRWVPTMQIGSGCKVHLADGELPMGRLVVSLSRHYTAVIDGIIHDTFDPQRDKSYSFETDHGQELKANQGRNQNGVWTEIGGRCVYGYWTRD